jgi:hypothetical protein
VRPQGLASRRPARPLMEFRGAPRTRIRPDQGGYVVPPDPSGVSTPLGSSSDRTSDGRSRRGPSCAFVLLQRSIAGVPRRPAGPKASSPDGASSPGLAGPTAHSRNGGPDVHGDGSLHRLVTRPGFGYPHRALHHRSYRRAKRRSAHGLRPSRLRSPSRRYPSRGLCPPDVAPPVPPLPFGTEERARPPSGRCSRDGATGSDPVRDRTGLPSWASPLQRTLSDRPGSRLKSRCQPSHPWGG